MTNLSPAAQAVLDAVREICPAPADEIAAVALRTAAEICAYPDDQGIDWILPSEIFTIAKELEQLDD